jgi:small-conductance mechanosensitive channel
VVGAMTDERDYNYVTPEALHAVECRVTVLEKQVEELTKSYTELRAELLRKQLRRNPQTEVPAQVSFGSVQALVEQVERMFVCKNGDHRAFHTAWSNEAPVGYREHYYKVLALIVPIDVANAQERLRQLLYIALFKLKATCKSEHPLLYWRYAEAERISEETNATHGYKIRMRVAIPEADYSVVGPVVQIDGQPIAVLRG